MSRVFIVAKETKTAEELKSGLARGGFTCSVSNDKESAVEQIARHVPDLVVVVMNGQASQSMIKELAQDIRFKKQPPVMALATEEILSQPESCPDVDDFIIAPFDARELVLRAKRLLIRNSKTEEGEVIRFGNLAIDIANCEVHLGGKLVDLTFKEYELLKFLANNRGRVFTREALLNKVWGYDYFGGDRTVDVHIRRLRSKIESSDDVFIETIRNIGYRFKKDL